jgi:predicted enzyme related to lactoylglutathione lyase/GNAT superfamily N-acetyltransferase
MVDLLVNVDVLDLEQGIRFYREGLGLRLRRRLGPAIAELAGAACPVFLTQHEPGARPFAGAGAPRDFGRHWTPVHLDFVVPDLDAGIRTAESAGATREGDIRAFSWGRILVMADPFGNGFCLLQFEGAGYAEIASSDTSLRRSPATEGRPGRMRIEIAETDEEIGRCFAAMRELRPQLVEASFLSRVRAQQRESFRLAFVCVDDRVVAVAGFRIFEALVDGRRLYVDDLVTSAGERSQGHGAALLRWLETHAVAEGCETLQLDSGLQRKRAHRFYEREGMHVSSLHFRKPLG